MGFKKGLNIIKIEFKGGFLMYITLKVGGKQYKLRYTMNSMCELERMTGKKLADIIDDGEFTAVRAMIWAALLPLNHSISLTAAGEIIDKYFEDGHNFIELSEIIKSVMSASGFTAPAPETNQEPETTGEKN